MSAKMKILSFAGSLLVLCACRVNGVQISFDFTERVNAIRVGNLSVIEFSTNIKSHFGNLTTLLKLSVSYSPDCNIFEECGPAVNEAVQILQVVKKNLFPHKVDIEHFKFRFRIDISALEHLNQSSMSQTKLNIPAGKHDVSFLLPDNTTCDDLKNVFWGQWDILWNSLIWVSPDSIPNVRYMGLGYNENLIGCENIYYYYTNNVVTTFSLGKTSCVVESFGLFKKRIDDLHARNIEWFIKYNDELPLIDYSSTTHCLGDEYYLHLLETYWERYSNDSIHATIPMPIGRYGTTSYSVHKIIPYIDAESCDGEESIPWYGPAALETLSRHFGAVVLTHAEWKELKSTDTNGESDIPLDLFIDFTDWLVYKQENHNFIGRGYNWSEVEIELNEATLNPLQNVKVTTLLFPITANPTSENFTVNMNFARRMSSRLAIGCAFGSNSFGTLANSTSSTVVAACQQVNGSIYTLQWQFKLKSITKVSKENSQHFENVLRPKLEEIKRLKEEILVLHPRATVYFHLRFELQMNDNQATVFCNSEAFSSNEFIEATVNWATFNGIPLIIGRAFDDNCHSKYQTWFSVLRPTEKSLKHIYPQFVLRNTPKILAEVDVEPCLEWTVQTPKVKESYFHNNYLGSYFETRYMRNDKPITQEEYKILLQFIFHRFDLVQCFVYSDTYNDFILAINELASLGLISATKQFFISYYNKGRTVDEMLQDIYGFVNFTNVTLGSSISILKGISFVIPLKIESESRKDDRHIIMAVEWGRSLGLDMAFEISTTECQNIHMNATSQKHISKENNNLLHSAKYLFCYENVDLKAYDNTKSLPTLFDKHLYVNRFFQDFYPHLDVYFNVFVEVSLTESTMPDYLILLSHFKKFAAAYNLRYIMVNAFDVEGDWQYGWWKVSNYSNLSLRSIYEEKYSAFSGFKTWLPPLNLKLNRTTDTANENQTKLTANDSSQNFLLLVTTSGFVLMVVVSGFLLWYYKNKKPHTLSNEEEKEFYNGKDATGEKQTAGNLDYLKFDKKFELSFADVFIDPKDLLGHGTFGTVYKGLVKGEPVAIKRPNDNCPATSFKSVLCEIKVLCYIGTHPNVVQFVGAYTKEIRKGILYIATELCSNGSLDGFLRAKKRVISNMGMENIGTNDEDSLYSHDLHRFAKEIASGMAFIVGKNAIHGDLAARNVLLDENFTCKIGDFGLSRKLYDNVQYVKQSQEPLPWKWMAYESLKNMLFTSKSDVWSYGVTLWEIYSLGSVPYGGLSWTTGFADDLKNGLRLQMPEYATQEIYKAMLSCWELEADERPTFTDMVDFFKSLTSYQYTVLEIQ